MRIEQGKTQREEELETDLNRRSEDVRELRAEIEEMQAQNMKVINIYEGQIEVMRRRISQEFKDLMTGKYKQEDRISAVLFDLS